MLSSTENSSIQWVGSNFAEVYQWLTDHSTSVNFLLRVLLPGNPNSTIEIQIDNLTLRLDIGNWIVRYKQDSKMIYYVVEDD